MRWWQPMRAGAVMAIVGRQNNRERADKYRKLFIIVEMLMHHDPLCASADRMR